VMNNLEFDHADIFENIQAIQKQFHHLVRIVPGEGLIISNAESPALDEVLDMGCWTPVEHTRCQNQSDEGWSARNISVDGHQFDLYFNNEMQGVLTWEFLGLHNVSNSIAAIAAARHAGVPVKVSLDALQQFKGVKRRLELRAEVKGIRLYDDFAHHPTAIKTTLEGLRGHVGDSRIWVMLEPRSNTMRLGVHKDKMATSLQLADFVCLYQPMDMDWDLDKVADSLGVKAAVYQDVDNIVENLRHNVQSGDHVLVMSNGGFGGIHVKLENMLKLL